MPFGKPIFQTHPAFCESQVVIPGKTGPTIQFRDKLRDQGVIQVDKICQYVIDCPGCGPFKGRYFVKDRL